MSIHSVIVEFRRYIVRLFTLPPPVSFHSFNTVFRHDAYSVCSVLSSLFLWYSPLLTTTTTTILRYARIIISTFYTHTHIYTFFIFSSTNTLVCRLIYYHRIFFSERETDREKTKPQNECDFICIFKIEI